MTSDTIPIDNRPADQRAAAHPKGTYVTHEGAVVGIKHMAKAWLIACIQHIRETEEFYQNSSVYKALLRELRRRRARGIER